MMKFLDEGNGRSKIENLAFIKNELEKLPSLIEEIKEFKIGLNISESPKAFDIVIDSIFDNEEKLKDYIIHPAHQELIKKLEGIREKTHVVDYKF